MAEIYYKLILEGRRVFHEVPDEIKPAVKQLLIQNQREDLIYV